MGLERIEPRVASHKSLMELDGVGYLSESSGDTQATTRQQTQRQLVLDTIHGSTHAQLCEDRSTRSTFTATNSAASENVKSSSSEMAKSIFRAAAAARRRRTGSFDEGRTTKCNVNENVRHQAQQSSSSIGKGKREQLTAVDFAREAPHAGYLSKLGSTVPEYKRRFFVLKPSTLLYYFLSPTDVEPRGCIDLSDAEVREVQSLADGRYRFEITFGDDSGGDKKVVLEARSKDVGRQWIESFRSERLSHAKNKLEESSRTETALRAEIDELNKKLESMSTVENEKDVAMHKLEKVHEGIRLLTKVIIRAGEDSGVKNADEDDGTQLGGEEQSRISVEDEQRLIDLSIPDSGFASLRSATESLRSSLKNTSKEAILALQDADMATDKVLELEESLADMQIKMQHLEEENSFLKGESQRRKRDNKVLVKEVKKLRVALETLQVEAEEAAAGKFEKGRTMNKSIDEEACSRLIAELEGHVATTLQLQRRLLSAGNKSESEAEAEADLESDSADFSSKLARNVDEGTSTCSTDASADERLSSNVGQGGVSSFLVSSKLSLSNDAIISSLIDDEGEDSSNGADDCAFDRTSIQDDVDLSSAQHGRIITETGNATSRLSCPLVDVIPTNYDYMASNQSKLGAGPKAMYHLTFSSRKIGLQFQRVPASSALKGSLTHVLAADMGYHSAGEKSSPNETELSKIAALAARSRAQVNCIEGEDQAKVPMPIDAVLVCGFLGFDDNVNLRRPDLGARLVAFDGMSVEVGAWTFDDIRKGIQARDRPITLSFRNDDLNLEQREILTRAVFELQSSSKPPKSNARAMQASQLNDDGSIHTFRSSLFSKAAPSSPGGTSIVSQLTTMSLNQRHQNCEEHSAREINQKIEQSASPYQLFRDMGDGSKALSSTSLTPLMSGLVSGLSNNAKSQRSCKDTRAVKVLPKYMEGEAESLNSHFLHHSFQASLL